MNRSLASLLLAVPIAVSIGCTKPDLDFERIRLGMTKNEVIARFGNPTRTSVVGNADLFEYEAYDHYGAMIINRRSQFVRFVNGRVEAYGKLEDLDAMKPASGTAEGGKKVGPDQGGESPRASAGASSSPISDLRTELEKLEKMKKDGLISEAEFKVLRQKVIEKAEAH